MSTVNNIQLFHIKNGLKYYIKINLTFSKTILNYLLQLQPKINQAPFTSDLFIPTETIVIGSNTYTINIPISNTNLYFFTGLMITELNSFITSLKSTFQSILTQDIESTYDFSFFNSFITTYETFFKNLVNYFNLFSFFSTMTYLPTFQTSTDIINSDLQTLLSSNKITLLQSSSLISINIRNMSYISKNVLLNDWQHMPWEFKCSLVKKE